MNPTEVFVDSSKPASVTLRELHETGRCTDALLLHVLIEGKHKTPDERAEVAEVAKALYGQENVPLLVADVCLHLLGLATFPMTPDGHKAIETVLVRVLDSRHSNLVVSAPVIMNALHVYAVKNVMHGFVQRLMEVGGTAILVNLELWDREAKKEVIFGYLSEHCADVFYKSWPRVAIRSGVTKAVSNPPTKIVECPILLDETQDPVLASDGHVYDRDAILTHLVRGNSLSPMTREMLSWIVHPV